MYHEIDTAHPVVQYDIRKSRTPRIRRSTRDATIKHTRHVPFHSTDIEHNLWCTQEVVDPTYKYYNLVHSRGQSYNKSEKRQSSTTQDCEAKLRIKTNSMRALRRLQLNEKIACYSETNKCRVGQQLRQQ